MMNNEMERDTVNNKEEQEFEKMLDTMNRIKLKAQVHKFNFKADAPNSVLAMYLLSKNDKIKEYFSKYTDKDDLNDDTLLIFNQRHVVEVCEVLAGLCRIFHFNESYVKDLIENVIHITNEPCFYSKFKSKINNLLKGNFKSRLSDSASTQAAFEKAFKTSECIFSEIWFVNYANLELMFKDMMEEFGGNK